MNCSAVGSYIDIRDYAKRTTQMLCNCYYCYVVVVILLCCVCTDPYVKVSLICDGRRLKKKKTTIKKNTLNPTYNEAIIFDIPPENMDQVSLHISVMDYDLYVKLMQTRGSGFCGFIRSVLGCNDVSQITL